MRISDWSSDVCSSDLVLDVRAEIEDQARAHGVVVDVVVVTRTNARNIVQIPVPALMIDGNAKACTVRQRRVENTLEATHAEVAGGTLEITAEFRRRLFRHQQHRAAGRVAAKQRAR